MEFSEVDQNNMLEFVTRSFYTYSKGDIGLHPFDGETNPIPPFSNDKYTFTKAFRYNLNGKLIAPEVGSLSMLAVDNNPLIIDLLHKIGPSVLLREIARFVRLALINQIILEELEKFKFGEPTYKKPSEPSESTGYGLVEASRGSLGHWIVIKNGKISNYQIITPTQINMGPEDPYGNPSHMSMALIGTLVEDPENPIEIAHIVRSHDACMVCNVHLFDNNKEKMVLRL
jgi:hydrogenase large subunit